MQKISKKTIVITTLLTAAPLFLGLILWNRLPEQVPVHFGFDGQPDNWSSRTFAVFGLPAFLLAVHMLCIKITTIDPKGKNITARIHSLVLWITPVISLFAVCLTYGTALGYEINVNRIASLMTGLLFMAVGNYLPKCRQNYTIGIKIPWTLADEENWNKTHRMAGPLWMAGGLIIMLAGFFSPEYVYVLLPVMILITFVPVIYSYLLYRRKGAGN